MENITQRQLKFRTDLLRSSDLRRNLDSAGIKESTYKMWIKDNTIPDPDSLLKVAKYFSTTLSYLCSRTDTSYPLSTYDYTPDMSRYSSLIDKTVTRNEIIEKCHISSATLAKLSKGYLNIRTETLFSVADELGVSPEYLLGLTDIKNWAIQKGTALRIEDSKKGISYFGIVDLEGIVHTTLCEHITEEEFRRRGLNYMVLHI